MPINCLQFNDQIQEIDWDDLNGEDLPPCLLIQIERNELLDVLPFIEQKLNVTINKEHVKDAMNADHPSFFDNTHEYEMVILKTLEMSIPAATFPPNINLASSSFVFFYFDNFILSVSDKNDFIMERSTHSFLRQKVNTIHSNIELLYSLLNLLIEQYLLLKAPLSQQYNEWQQLMLGNTSNFHLWNELITYKSDIEYILALCEECEETLEDWRRYTKHHNQQQFMINLNDLEEHAGRAIHYANRLTENFDTLIQLHFSAISHRNNEILKILAIISAIFMPLTVITGVFGMNFENMPFLHKSYAYDLTIFSMVVVSIGLLVIFRWKKWI